MSAKQAGIEIDPVGIADILHRSRLTVPLNQRPYAWEEEQVEKLFEDLNKSFDGQPLYFIGTVMFTQGENGLIEVADGQQRLATVSILIGAIRDYLLGAGDEEGAKQYQSDFLIKYDPPSGSYKPRLTLNQQDNELFHQQVLLPPDKRPKLEKPRLGSHQRLVEAIQAARQHVLNITSSLPPADKLKRLYSWMEYLKATALVIVVKVPSSVGNSFKMFETLNARGVPATEVDILKNFLFDKAPESAPAIMQAGTRW